MAVRSVELATGNILFGRFTWLYIEVPEGWAVKVGDSSADVNYTAVIKEVGWVLDGSSSFYIVNLINGAVVEMDVKCRKGVKLPSEKALTEKITVNGHESYIYTKTVKRIFTRNIIHQTKITIPCADTKRTIEITVTAENHEDIKEQMKHLPNYRCH